MSILQAIHKIGRLIFTTREIAGMTGASIASTTQVLKRLEKQEIIRKIKQGLWGMTSDRRFSPFLVIPFLEPNHRSYLSFISALHNYGVISQIPQTTTVASTSHSKKIVTSVGVFEIHQISPDFFNGFDWHSEGDYLIAMPEKAFVDCLYLATRKSRRYKYFPELDLSLLGKKLVFKWAGQIKDKRIRDVVMKEVKIRYKNAGM